MPAVARLCLCTVARLLLALAIVIVICSYWYLVCTHAVTLSVCKQAVKQHSAVASAAYQASTDQDEAICTLTFKVTHHCCHPCVVNQSCNEGLHAEPLIYVSLLFLFNLLQLAQHYTTNIFAACTLHMPACLRMYSVALSSLLMSHTHTHVKEYNDNLLDLRSFML
jgi:hypothetical protein